LIEARGLTKWYPTVRGPNVVLDNVDFSLGARDNLAIFGFNGAGKSTLLRVIGGAEAASAGEVIRRGKVSWPIGFRGGFNPSLTGEENCRFVARIYAQDVDEVVAFASDFADVGDYFYMPLRTYSSGMRARLAFGVSMALDFDTYLVDEVIAVGDRTFKEKCVETFRERSNRASLIMVSHQVETLRRYCNRGAVLYRGKLTLYDTVDDAAKIYGELARE